MQQRLQKTQLWPRVAGEAFTKEEGTSAGPQERAGGSGAVGHILKMQCYGTDKENMFQRDQDRISWKGKPCASEFLKMARDYEE